MKNNKIKLVSLLLILTMISMSLASGTFAKYTTKISGNDQATAKTFSFNVKNGDPSADGIANLLPGKFAPGESDFFKLDLVNNSEVSVDIEFTPTVATNYVGDKTFPIMYAVFAEAQNAATLEDADYNVAATGLKAALDAEFTAGIADGTDITQSVYVYWKWVDTEYDNEFIGKTYTLGLDVTATQK